MKHTYLHIIDGDAAAYEQGGDDSVKHPEVLWLAEEEVLADRDA